MIVIFSDGGSRGNPGRASCAFGVYDNEKLIYSDATYLGITTNNVAEYSGVILALEWVAKNLKDEKIIFNLDSELVVKQLKGIYRIKDKNLIELSMKVRKLITENKLDIEFVHVRREKNAFADKLVNEKLDESSRL